MRFVPFLLLLPLASCDQSQPQTPATQPAAAQATQSTPTSATPILDAYRAVWRQIDRDKLMPLMFLYPARPSLQFDPSAPPNSRQDLIALLNSLQPQLKRIIELSAKSPEPFPPHPSESEVTARDAHMDHPMAWFQNFARLLNADAMRCNESGDAAATIPRVIASIRLGEAMQSQSDDLDRIAGVGIMGQGLKLANALLDAGLASKAGPAAIAELRTAASSFTIRDSQQANSLSGMINQDLQTLRQKLAK